MEGEQHVTSTWSLGAAVAYALGLPDLGVIGFASVSAGAGAANDLDHESSAATRVLGSGSEALSGLVRLYAKGLYQATRGPGDPRTLGAHRGATHSLPLLLLPMVWLYLLPALATALVRMFVAYDGSAQDPELIAHWAGPVATACTAGFCLLLAVDRIGDRRAAGMIGLGLLLTGTWRTAVDPARQLWDDPGSWSAMLDTAGQQLLELNGWIALAVFVGTVGHCIGDLLTEHGLYLLAPLYRRNAGTDQEERWVRIALPKAVAFKTGKWFEHSVMRWSLRITAVLVTPGVWDLVWPVARPLLLWALVAVWTLVAVPFGLPH